MVRRHQNRVETGDFARERGEARATKPKTASPSIVARPIVVRGQRVSPSVRRRKTPRSRPTGQLSLPVLGLR